jgi:hypothetical protein
MNGVIVILSHLNSWKKRKNLLLKGFLLMVGSVLGCIAVGLALPALGIICGISLLTGPGVGTYLDLEAVEQEIRDQGCACIM